MKSALSSGKKKPKKKVSFAAGTPTGNERQRDSLKLTELSAGKDSWPLEGRRKRSFQERAVRDLVDETNILFLGAYGKPLSLSQSIVDYRVKLRMADFSDVMHLAPLSSATKKGKPKKAKRKLEAMTEESKNDSVSVAEPLKSKRQRLASAVPTAVVTTESLATDAMSEALRMEEVVESAAVTTVLPPADYSAAAGSGALALAPIPATSGPPVVGLRTLARRTLAPRWHAPWELYKVISGHMSWVQAIAFDPSNEWFATGSGDRTIKIWDFPSGKLKLTLTGHISNVRGLAVSSRQPYMFSCSEDKKVLCWDLEQNKVVRSYHGHLSGVYSLAMHPTLDILATGGRDAAVRVWDIRTKAQVLVLSGHKHTVASLLSQSSEPQLISGSHDGTVRCWDLRKAATRAVLTHHKKAVRALVRHSTEYTFASAAADNIKVWKCPEASFLRNMQRRPESIVECMALNGDGVLVSGHQTGHLKFWDWKSGRLFQTQFATPQPGSLQSEAGVAAAAFDRSGARLVTCEFDKTIKMWRQKAGATPETHPF